MKVRNYMWVGLVAPQKTPAAVVEKLREMMGKAVEHKAFVEAIEKLGGKVHYLNGDEMAKFWDQESKDHHKLLTEFEKEGLKIKG